MARPTFRRFWIKILPDGTADSQFDPFTGRTTEKYSGPAAQVLFYPITPKLAELIKSNGDQAEASHLKPLVFDIPPGGEYKFHRTGKLRYDLQHICGFCEAEFSSDLDVCPRCLAKNQWYCGACDELKPEPLIVDGVARCPECEGRGEPRGLKRVQCIGEFYSERLFTNYFLEVSGKKHLILDYKIVRR
jgi:hypothetical protein